VKILKKVVNSNGLYSFTVSAEQRWKNIFREKEKELEKEERYTPIYLFCFFWL